MKKSIFAKIGAAAVVLTLVTSSLVGGTFAKYVTNAEGKATASVAKWSVDFKNGENSITLGTPIVLKNEDINTATADGTIAPGSHGTIEITVKGSDSGVGYSYTITGDISGLKDIPLSFYTESDMAEAHKIEITENGSKKTFTLDKKEIEYSSETGKMDDIAKIYWKWDSNADADDTALGVVGTTGDINLTMTAEQLIKTTSAE